MSFYKTTIKTHSSHKQKLLHPQLIHTNTSWILIPRFCVTDYLILRYDKQHSLPWLLTVQFNSRILENRIVLPIYWSSWAWHRPLTLTQYNGNKIHKKFPDSMYQLYFTKNNSKQQREGDRQECTTENKIYVPYTMQLATQWMKYFCTISYFLQNVARNNVHI